MAHPRSAGFGFASQAWWACAALLVSTSLQAQPPSKPRTVVSPTAVEPLDEATVARAAGVYVGTMPCELGQRVSLQPDPNHPGYFNLQWQQQRFHLRPVETHTGALRLEDLRQGAVWIQLANKSMLMSQKLGRRLADECMGPVQKAHAEHLRAHPAPDLLDVAQRPDRQD